MNTYAPGFLILAFWSAQLFAQSSNFTVYSIEEGIPQSQVHAILQDKKGFLWFGTDGGGFTRYDGKRFITITTTEGLCNDLVYTIEEDKEGTLWLGTAKGISIYRNNKLDSVPKVFAPLADLTIRSMEVHTDGTVAFGTSQGLFIYRNGNLSEEKSLSGKVITGLYFSKDGALLAGTSNDGFRIIKPNGKVVRIAEGEGLSNNTVHCFIEYKDQILVGTERGVNFFDSEFKCSPFPVPAPVGSKQIIRFLELDRNGDLWIGTLDCGNYVKSGDSFRRFGKSEGVGVEGAFCMEQDHEGNIWIGTDGNGAVKLGKQTFTSISKENGLPHDMILSMCKSSKGGWWFGHHEGATFYDGASFKYFGKKEGLTNEKVWSIFEDKAGKIWISTYGSGVFQYDGRAFKNYSEKNGLSSNNVRAIFQDSKGRMWIGTANGLNLMQENGFVVFRTDDGLGTNRVLCFYEDKKGTLWIGTSGNGLARVIEENGKITFRCFNEKEGMADNVILSIAEDKNGTIWTGNFGGISYVNPSTGKAGKITKKDGLGSNTVYAISFADEEHLLVGSNNGVDKLNIASFLRDGSIDIRHFGKEEGFKGVECNTGSVKKDTDGKIWFGTIKGVFIYDPSKDLINQTQPITHITGLRLFFENENLYQYSESREGEGFLPSGVTFPYDKNHLTFEFSGLSFMIPQHVQYSYMIEGFDKSWSRPAPQAFATYSNLPPGKYTFMVRASNSDGIWNEQPARYSFVILPPFWKTWWFFTICVISLTLGIYALFRYRMRRLERIQLMLKEQVNLKTRELREEKEVVEKQNLLIEKKNKDITSSIRYAQRIQESILPNKEKLNDLLPESFIMFRPKDIVSGDFYWFTRQNGSTLVAAVDCTGHGVPGAFMSLIGNNLLNHIVNDLKISDPKTILENLHEGVVQALKKNETESGTVDGMDITLCTYHHKNKLLEFASTGRPLILAKGKSTKKFKIGKHPVGLVTRKQMHFEKQSIQLDQGDSFYIFTDGYCDQFGGPEDDKYMEVQFETVLSKIQDLTMQEQLRVIESELDTWKGERSQLDDILVIGIKAV